MSGVHWHLVLNHIPILGTFFGVVILLLGMVVKKISYKRLGLGTFVVIALLTVPVYLTGEPAEEAVEQVNVPESLIEAHEEAGETAFWGMMILGALALVTLIWDFISRSSLKGMSYLVLIAGILVGSYMGYVGNLGGQIRHSEIRQEGEQSEGSKLPADNHEEDEQEEE